jgi:hypothetical protein
MESGNPFHYDNSSIENIFHEMLAMGEFDHGLKASTYKMQNLINQNESVLFIILFLFADIQSMKRILDLFKTQKCSSRKSCE